MDAPHEHLKLDVSQQHQKSADAHVHFKLDRCGIAISSICIAHCLILPLSLVFLPFFRAIAGWHLWIHFLIVILAVPIAWASLRQGVRHHGKHFVLYLGGLGAALIVITLVYDWWGGTHYDSIEEPLPWTLAVSILGGLFLVAAHSLNLRLCSSKRSLNKTTK